MKLQITWKNETTDQDEVYEGEIPNIIENDELLSDLEDKVDEIFNEVNHGWADFFAHEDKVIGWHLNEYSGDSDIPQHIFETLEKMINENHT